MVIERANQIQCLICKKNFGHRGQLNIHVKIVHENAKPFACLICKKSFGQKGHLKTHTKIVHEKVIQIIDKEM